MRNLRIGTLGALSSFVLLFSLSDVVSAQQFVVDDAAITERGACQVEAWWGESESWILPACTLLPGTEITVGLAHLDAGVGGRQAHGVLELKWLGRDSDAGPWGWGIVAGAALPFDGASSLTSAWVFLPLTVHASAVPATLHLNGGWGLERELHGDPTHDQSGFAWGARGDLELLPRVTLIGEVFGLSGEGAEGQAGLRTALIPERLTLDLSWATHFSSGEEGLGLQLGLAWTPPPFFRPRPLSRSPRAEL